MTESAQVSDEQRRQMIAQAAYFRAERRGFNGGDPADDWFEAEAEVEAILRNGDGQHFLQRLDERLATVSDKLEEFKAHIAGMTAHARKEWEHEVEKLGKLRESLQKDADKLRSTGRKVSDKVRHQADKTWDDISKILEHIHL